MTPIAAVIICAIITISAVCIIALYFKAQFKKMSDDLLEQSAETLKKENSDVLARSVEPLERELKEFREKVESVNTQSAERGGRLEANIKNLVEKTNDVSNRAENLATAIRGRSQVTGQWGEMQLQNLLNACGLSEGNDYTYQETIPGANQRMDFKIKLPNDRFVIVDSKVTLESFAEYFSKEGEEKKAAEARLITSLKNHVDEIARAGYQNKIKGAFPYALMYIPLEDVYLCAMKALLPSGIPIWSYAWEKKVLLVNYASLLTTLQSIAMMWSADNADRKAQEIKEKAVKLIDKAENFLKNYKKLGEQIKATSKTFDESLKQFAEGPGNVQKQLEDISRLSEPKPRNLNVPEPLAEESTKD